MLDHPAILFANDAFYTAFSARDYQAMDDIWSHQQSVTCIHPGWQPLRGRTDVMESWRAILGSPSSPRITFEHPSIHQLGGVGYVLCYERFNNGFLIATNIFIQEDNAWRMVHHQAGAVPAPEIAAGNARPTSLQ